MLWPVGRDAIIVYFNFFVLREEEKRGERFYRLIE
jgi:hypothetical protein